MNRCTAFAFVVTLGLGVATLAYAIDQPKDVSPTAALENPTPQSDGSTGTGQTPTAGPRTMSQTMSQNVIKGEIMKIDGAFYVIKDSSGKEVRIQVDKDTLSGNGPVQRDAFKAGDKIEAELTPQVGRSADGRPTYVTTEGWGHAKSLKAVGTGVDKIPAPND